MVWETSAHTTLLDVCGSITRAITAAVHCSETRGLTCTYKERETGKEDKGGDKGEEKGKKTKYDTHVYVYKAWNKEESAGVVNEHNL